MEIEFLTDQTGLRPNTVLEVQKGLHAEALRYVSILVENTLELVIDYVGTIQDGPPIIVQVPTPAAYIFQKGLSVTRRRESKRRPKTFTTSSTFWPDYWVSKTKYRLILKLFQKNMPSDTGNSCQISQRISEALPPKAPCGLSSKDQRMHFLEWMMIN